jgi:protein-S-isoprenylcysteine O-methyltransferase Ste14
MLVLFVFVLWLIFFFVMSVDVLWPLVQIDIPKREHFLKEESTKYHNYSHHH